MGHRPPSVSGNVVAWYSTNKKVQWLNEARLDGSHLTRLLTDHRPVEVGHGSNADFDNVTLSKDWIGWGEAAGRYQQMAALGHDPRHG